MSVKVRQTFATLLSALLCATALTGCMEDDFVSVSAVVAEQEEQDSILGAIEDGVYDLWYDYVADEATKDAIDAAVEDYNNSLGKEAQEAQTAPQTVAYGEYYYDLDNVVLYLDTYGELPENYITKAEARALGWEGGSVEVWQDGAAIGGDTFGNREGLLPEGDWIECDIDTDGESSRGASRLVFDLDLGLYYFTDDHYESFVLVETES